MMTIKLLFIPAGLLLLSACGNQVSSTGKNAKVYTGDFAGAPLELTLIQLDAHTIKGESKHKGYTSEMSGRKQASEKGYTYVMKELGNGPYEGVFEFELDTSLNIIFGSWQRADTTNRTAIVYTLRPKLGQ